MTLRIAIVIGSTRPGRKGAAVARWVLDNAVQRPDASYELVDLLDHGLPLLDEPLPAYTGQYSQPHTRAWAATIEQFDGFVFVTPEYNRGTSAALKNALDFLYAEWGNKVAGFVSYGFVGGTRAVEQLRLTACELQMAAVRTQVALMSHVDFDDDAQPAPEPRRRSELTHMLDELESWAAALQPLRAVAHR